MCCRSATPGVQYPGFTKQPLRGAEAGYHVIPNRGTEPETETESEEEEEAERKREVLRLDDVQSRFERLKRDRAQGKQPLKESQVIT